MYSLLSLREIVATSAFNRKLSDHCKFIPKWVTAQLPPILVLTYTLFYRVILKVFMYTFIVELKGPKRAKVWPYNSSMFPLCLRRKNSCYTARVCSLVRVIAARICE